MRCVHFFLIFLLIINREPDSVLFVSANKKRLQNKFTDKLKANLWIHLDLAKVYRLKELASPSHLSSLSKFKKYSDSTQTFAIAEPMFDLTQIMFGF